MQETLKVSQNPFARSLKVYQKSKTSLNLEITPNLVTLNIARFKLLAKILLLKRNCQTINTK